MFFLLLQNHLIQWQERVGISFWAPFMMTLAVILLCGFLFPRKPLYSLFLLFKKIISIIASQNKEKRRCVICPWVRVVGPQELSLFSCAGCAPVHLLGWRSSLLLIATKKQGWAKGRGRPKAQSAPTKLDPGALDTEASTRVTQQPLAVHSETAGIKEVILADWSIAQCLPMDRRVMVLASYCMCAKVTDPHLLSLLIPSFDVLLNLELS